MKWERKLDDAGSRGAAEQAETTGGGKLTKEWAMPAERCRGEHWAWRPQPVKETHEWSETERFGRMSWMEGFAETLTCCTLPWKWTILAEMLLLCRVVGNLRKNDCLFLKIVLFLFWCWIGCWLKRPFWGGRFFYVRRFWRVFLLREGRKNGRKGWQKNSGQNSVGRQCSR